MAQDQRYYAGGQSGYFGAGGIRQGGAQPGFGSPVGGNQIGIGDFMRDQISNSKPYQDTANPPQGGRVGIGDFMRNQASGGNGQPGYVTTSPGQPTAVPSGTINPSSVPEFERETNIQDDPAGYIKRTAGRPLDDLDPAGIFGGRATENAAGYALNAERRAQGELGRQFDITQEQFRPYREAGDRGLGQWEDLINRRDEFGVDSNLPGAYQSEGNVPSFGFNSGQYGAGQGNVAGGFRFGQNEFNQYKDPGYDFEVEESLRGLDRSLASRGKRKSGVRSRALMERGQGMASEEFGRARNRARGDYGASVGRERSQYGRNVSNYGRQIGRESELYGRARNNYQDRVGREQTLSDRNYMDYTSQVGREEGAYNRSVEDYARNYIDPMNRYAQLAGRGQSANLGLAQLRSSYSQNIGNSANRMGDIEAARGLGQAKGYAQMANTVGGFFNQSSGSVDPNAYNPLDDPSSLRYNNP